LRLRRQNPVRSDLQGDRAPAESGDRGPRSSCAARRGGAAGRANQAVPLARERSGFSGLEREDAEGMGSGVELFERIRGDLDREGPSIRELARRHGVHRRALRQALPSALPLPPPRKRPERRPAPSSARTGRCSTSTTSTWPRRRCATTCAAVGVSWARRSMRCSCRRYTSPASRPRSTGARLRSRSPACGAGVPLLDARLLLGARRS
jgi:hypothetical protein